MGHRRWCGASCLFPSEADETAQPGPIDGIVPIDDMVGAFDEGGSRRMLSCYDESAAGGVVDIMSRRRVVREASDACRRVVMRLQ